MREGGKCGKIDGGMVRLREEERKEKRETKTKRGGDKRK